NKRGTTPSTTSTAPAIWASGTYYSRVTAQDAAGNVSPPSNEAPATVTVDTTAPAVSITAPSNGATVSGVISITANATDNVAVAGVQFLLDGANLGAEVTGPGPSYVFAWTTSTTSNGAHTLSARARDGAGNTTTATNVGVTVANSGPSGVVAAYNFNEGSGTTVTDSSGNGLTGTITNATWSTSGKNGGALSFNGSTSSKVQVPSAAPLNVTALTLEAWVQPTAAQSGWRAIIQRQTDG